MNICHIQLILNCFESVCRLLESVLRCREVIFLQVCGNLPHLSFG